MTAGTTYAPGQLVERISTGERLRFNHVPKFRFATIEKIGVITYEDRDGIYTLDFWPADDCRPVVDNAEELKALQKCLRDTSSADWLEKYGTEWTLEETMLYARGHIEGGAMGTYALREALAWYADDEEQFLRGDGAPYASVPPKVSSTAKASRAALRRDGGKIRALCRRWSAGIGRW